MRDPYTRGHVDVAIVGAGLAGLTAAVELIMCGKRVNIFEAGSVPGGRTSSWQTGQIKIESGLHRYIGIYTELPELLKKVNVNLDDIIKWEDQFITLSPTQKATYGASPRYRLRQTITSFIGNNHFLNWKDKLSLIPFGIFGILDYLLRPNYLDGYSVLEYAKTWRVTDKAINHILVPFTAGLFFIRPSKYSAFVLFSVFTYMVLRIFKMRIGSFKAGMTEILIQPIVKWIERNGGKVFLNSKITDLIIEKGSVVGVRTQDREIKAESVVLASGLGEAKRLVLQRSEMADKFPELQKLESMPDISVQFELSEPALANDITHFGIGSRIGAFSEQSRSTFSESKGRLSVILTEPETLIDLPADKIIDLTYKELHKLGINIKSKVIQAEVVKHKDAFYRLEPGQEKYRPKQYTRVKGLFLAGDYTKQKFLSTMEGAVISGRLAAQAILADS